MVQFLLVRRQGNWKQTDQVSFHNSQAEPGFIIIGNQTDMVGFGWDGLVQSAFWFSFTPLAYILMVAVPNFLLLVQNVDMKIWLGRHFHDSHNMLPIEEHELASLMGVPIT